MNLLFELYIWHVFRQFNYWSTVFTTCCPIEDRWRKCWSEFLEDIQGCLKYPWFPVLCLKSVTVWDAALFCFICQRIDKCCSSLFGFGIASQLPTLTRINSLLLKFLKTNWYWGPTECSDICIKDWSSAV